MTKHYEKRPQHYLKTVGLVVLWLATLGAWKPTSGQTVASYSFSQSTGTYNPITGGTVLGTATDNTFSGSLDDQIFNIPAFPFTFTFAGTGYTSCNVSTNGFITFGATAPAASNYSPISSDPSPNYSGAVSAFGGDLNSFFNISSQTGEIRWQVVGTAPNREIVIQWANFRPAFTTSTTNVYAMNFQIRLEETTNNVRVVYGSNSYLVGSTTISGARQIGLRGASSADFNNRTNNTSTAFTASSTGTSSSETQSFNTVTNPPGMPTNGLIYTWQPPSSCSGTPTAGTTVANPTSVCYGGSTTLSLTGATVAVGITYQWQSASAAAGPYTNIIGATSATYTATNITANTFFRCRVTCTLSGLFADSAPVGVPVSTPPQNIPYIENFNSTTPGNIPNCWSRNLVSGTNNWQVGTTADAFEITSNFDGNFAYKFYQNSEAWFISPALNLSAAGSSPAELSVQIHRRSPADASDVISFYVNTQPDLTGATLLQTYPSLITGTSPATPHAAAVGAVSSNGWYNYTMNIPVPFNTAPAVYVIAQGITNGGFSSYAIAFDELRVTPPCSGTPTAGTLNIVSQTVCNPTNLTATGSSSGPGITYQWEISTTSATSGFTDVVGANTITYTAPAPTVTTWYRLRVTCTNSSLFATTSAAQLVPFATPISTFPYIENFDGVTGISGLYTPSPTAAPTNGAMPCGWTVQNINNDANTWYNFNAPSAVATPPNAMVYRWNTTNAANDWAFTPALNLRSDRSYTVTFKAKASDAPTYVEAMEIRWGTAADAASMPVANTIYNNTNIDNPTFQTFSSSSFTPPTTGTYFIGFFAKSAADQAILYVDDVEITEACPTVTFTPPAGALPAGTIGSAYNQTISQTGLAGTLTWSVSVGTLPAGLSLNTSTGQITGTPTALGTSSFTIQVTDGTCSATAAYSITINPSCPVITVNPTTLPNGNVNVAYSQTITATGGTAPYTFTVSSGTLPTGLTLNASTGVISGTVTSAVSASFTITATDASTNACTGSRAYTINFTQINGPIIELTGNLDFGDVLILQSATQKLTIRNIGNAPLNVSDVSLPPTVFTANFAGSIAPGASQEVDVIFTPIAVATYSGNIVVTSNAVAGNNTIFVTGKGINPTAIGTTAPDFSIKAYPNPSQGSVFVKFENVHLGDYQINVTDILGRSMRQSFVKVNRNGQEVELNLSGLAEGMYLLQLDHAKGRTVISFVKK